jgi:CheY-like chemotaxis protein
MPILLTENDADAREAIAAVLKIHGYRVIAAESAEEALGIVRAGVCPSLIMMDLTMPGMDPETFRREQLGDPRIASVPFVVESGHPQAEHRAQAMGAVALLRKPFDPATLLSTVEKFAPRSAAVART